MNIFGYISELNNLHLPLTYKVITFGCQMNAKDSEKLEGMLHASGFTEANDEKEADIVIFNTCTVRENANNTLYGHVGELKKSYMKNKKKIICICGCMMQEKDEVEVIKEKYPYVKIIFGTYNIHEFPELLYDYINTNKKIFKIYDEPQGIIENLPTINKYKEKCGINISYGCNNYCTYCIVPYVRGPERTRIKDDIIREVKEQVANGVEEVMLLGQNVNSYGNDNNECSFPELLKEVAKIDGLKRIRFMTSHPKDFSSELIKVIKDNEKIVKHIHLPMQSGSDKILNAMNRHYTREKYISIIDEIKKEIPDISITTDIIVGFPGETEDDFRDTLSLVEYCKFDSAFMFMYSKRNGTPAVDFPDQVDEKVMSDRFNRLLSLVNKLKNEAIKKGKAAVSFLLILSFLFLPLSLIGCASKNKELNKTFFALDTFINIKEYNYENVESGTKWLDYCEEEIKKYENLFSRTIKDSDISKINKKIKEDLNFEKADEFILLFQNEISDNTLELTKEAIEYSKNIDEDFDIHLGELNEIWARAREKVEEAEDTNTHKLPSHAAIDTALQNIKNKKYQYDFGAVAKGYIADKLVEKAKEYGVDSCIINLGGNVYAIGDKYGSDFTVGIEEPFTDIGKIIDIVKVKNKSVVTSGIYQRYFEAACLDNNFNPIENTKYIYHHILNNKTGYPANTDIYSATVVCSDSSLADMLATSLILHNIEDGKIIVEKASKYYDEDIDIIIVDNNKKLTKYSY